jgi:flagellar FliL protein
MAEGGEVKEASGGKGGFVIALLLLAVLGAGAGAGFSMTVLNADATGGAGKGTTAGKQDSHKAADAGKHGETPGAAKGSDASVHGAAPKDEVVGLDPILVTLAGPQKSWARLELSVVIGTGEKDEKGEKDDRTTLLKVMSEDLMSFLRTVPLSHVESSVGLEYLREDLSEIARLRSKGQVRGVVLRSLVVE